MKTQTGHARLRGVVAHDRGWPAKFSDGPGVGFPYRFTVAVVAMSLYTTELYDGRDLARRLLT